MSAGERKDYAWLFRGWQWLEGHPGHPDHDRLEAEWCRRLIAYERVYREAHLRTEQEQDGRARADV